MPQMNMADHRGAVRGRVSRNASGAPVADATVTAVNEENGAQFTAATDQQGAYSFGALPVGKIPISIRECGVTDRFRRRGVAIEMDAATHARHHAGRGDRSRSRGGERQELLQKIATLEQRITDLESSTVFSDPETRVRRVEVYVDAKGSEHDEPVPESSPRSPTSASACIGGRRSAKRSKRRLRTRTSRACHLASTPRWSRSCASHEGARRDTAMRMRWPRRICFSPPASRRTRSSLPTSSALSGSPPDAEIPTLTLLNGYTARLETQNELNLREAWLRTELFGQRLALTAGRLDLTNYFDANALANDESTQFLSDALVNNQMLGLASNGTGVATEFDAKNGFRFKFGFQQSNNEATNLSDSMFTLREVGYTFTPFALPEGTSRVPERRSFSFRRTRGASVGRTWTWPPAKKET